MSKYTINPRIGKKNKATITSRANSWLLPLRIASRYAHTHIATWMMKKIKDRNKKKVIIPPNPAASLICMRSVTSLRLMIYIRGNRGVVAGLVWKNVLRNHLRQIASIC